MLQKAISLAKEKHQGQKRKSGEDYIIHPLAVLKILKDHNFPEEALCAAVLHDICEDTEISALQIGEMFSERVGFMLYALSKNKKPKQNKMLKDSSKKEWRKKGTQEKDYRFSLYVHKLHLCIGAEPWILFIKIADQLHNLSTLEFFPQKKQRRKIEEVEKFFLPIYKKAEEVIPLEYIKRYHIFVEKLERLVKTLDLSLPSEV
jgi:(p)ppGpp synthase/HD superfamily hydrolase